MSNQEYRQTEVAWDTGETRGLWHPARTVPSARGRGARDV